jgi:hypothetical protein
MCALAITLQALDAYEPIYNLFFSPLFYGFPALTEQNDLLLAHAQYSPYKCYWPYGNRLTRWLFPSMALPDTFWLDSHLNFYTA